MDYYKRALERTVDRRIAVNFSYAAMNDIMRIVKEEQPAVESQRFDNLSSIVLRIRASRAERLTERLRKVEGGVVGLLKVRILCHRIIDRDAQLVTNKLGYFIAYRIGVIQHASCIAHGIFCLQLTKGNNA